MNITLENDRKFDIEIVLIKTVKNCSKKQRNLLKEIGFSAKEGEVEFIGKKVFVGLDGYKSEDIKIALSYGMKRVQKSGYENIKINLLGGKREFKIRDLVEGILLGSYSFDRYKSSRSSSNKNIFIDTTGSELDKKTLQKEFDESIAVAQSVNFVRDIVNTPPQDFFPKTMAQVAIDLTKESSLECKVYGEKYLEENKMEAMLSVGRASRHESQLIHLSYKPKDPKGVVVIVGKGVTYDSGGLSLKPANGMISMKCDKSGASAVLGVMKALESIDCQMEVHGIIGAVENMLGGDAFKPDDVLVAKNGKTIEVRSTDAEGRLILADCLCYAQESVENIDYIFDIATLTGATIIGLGEYTTGVMGHSKALKKRIEKSSKASGDLVGFLPFNRFLPKMIKSEIADISNSSASKAGSAITAALFRSFYRKKE